MALGWWRFAARRGLPGSKTGARSLKHGAANGSIAPATWDRTIRVSES